MLESRRHHSAFLQHTWNKHGPEDFAFEVVVFCDTSMLNDLEQCLLDDPNLSPFNIARCAEAPMRGASEATRAKISASLTGKRPSEATLAKMRARMVSDATKEKLRKAQTGQKHSEATLQKMRGRSAPNKGVSPSEEVRAKLRAANLGKTPSAATRSKLSAALRGKPKANKGGKWTPERRAAHKPKPKRIRKRRALTAEAKAWLQRSDDRPDDLSI